MAYMEFLYGEIKDQTISEKDLLITAYHEAAHAILGLLLEAFPYAFDNLTMSPRADFLGMATSRYENDVTVYTKDTYKAMIKVSLGGMIIEQLKFEKHTSTVSSDLNHITKIAYDMFTKFGMGKNNIVLIESDKNISADVKKEADDLIAECKNEVKEFLLKRMHILDEIVKNLMVKKTLYYDDMKIILEKFGEVIPKK